MPVYRGGKPPITYGTFYSGGGYLPGVIALARSLKGVSSCVPLTVFADKGLGADQRALLERNGISVSVLDEVTVPDSVKRLNDVAGSAIGTGPSLSSGYSRRPTGRRLSCWMPT